MSRRHANRKRHLQQHEVDAIEAAVFRAFLRVHEVRTFLDGWTIAIDPRAVPPIRITRREAVEEPQADGCAQP